MKKGVVSVIIPCFNGETTLDTCFRCLLQQTDHQLEIIFVDDGSSDRSFEKAHNYIPFFASQGIVIKCISQKNAGAGYATAKGLLYAEGEYVMCFDVDDILYPNSIEKQALFLLQHPEYALVRTNGYLVSADGRKKTLFITDDSEKKNEHIFEDLLFGGTNNWAGSYMVRAESLWKIYPNHSIPQSRYGQNLQILMAVAWENKAGFIDEPLMEYRFNPNSFTHKDDSFEGAAENLFGFKHIRIDILDALGISTPDLLQRLEKTYALLFLDLCILHKKGPQYVEQYDLLKTYETPACIYRYYYHLYRGNRVRAFFYRLSCNKFVGQLLRFGIVGVLATLLHYAIYLGLKAFLPFTIAYIIGYGCSFIANYFLSASFTFQKKTSLLNGVGFLGAHLFNLLLQTGLLNFFTHLGINSNWAPIPVYAIAIPLNFLMVRFVFSRFISGDSLSDKNYHV